MTDTLLAIDETYRRWADILDLVVAGQMDEAKYFLNSTNCPLCRLVRYHCSRCPVVIEYKMEFSYGVCANLNVYNVASDGVTYGDDIGETIIAILKILFILDWLWERVRKREG